MPNHDIQKKHHGRRFRAGSLLVAMLVLGLLLVGPGGALALLQAAQDGPSPAQGTAEVIAHGVSQMPADQIAWRVVTDDAENLETAEPLSRPLGFALADQDAIIVNDVTLGIQTRNAPGEASFTLDNSIQQRASLIDSTVTYYGIALVPSDQATQAAEDQLVFGGDAFAAPSGGHDIDLVRDVLATDEQTTIADSGFPVLVLATAGSISIQSSGEPTTLQAGEAAQVSGSLQITGQGDESAFVAAVIGPEVPPPPRFTGTIAIGVYQCPPGVTQDDLTNAPSEELLASCTALEDAVDAGFDVSLSGGPDNVTLPLSATVPPPGGEAGVYVWDRLQFGDYVIGDPSSLPEGYDSFLLTDENFAPRADGNATVSRDTPDVRANFFLLSSANGSVTVTVFNCPEGMTPDTLVGEDCTQATEGFELQLEGGSLENPLTTADGANEGGVITWSDLPLSSTADAASGDPGTYHVTETTLPDGYESYIVTGPEPLGSGGDFVVLTADAPTANVEIFNFTAAVTTGTIVLNSYLCPAAGASDEECQAGGGVELTTVTINSNDGITVLDLGNANIAVPAYTWSGLPFGDYTLDQTSLGVPAGLVIDRIDTDTVSIDSSSPQGTINVYFAPESGATPAP
jgi:hypothetical protein